MDLRMERPGSAWKIKWALQNQDKEPERTHSQRIESIRTKPTDWIEANVLIESKRPNMHWRPWWVLPTNLEHIKFPSGYRRESVILAGRQVEKSTGLAMKSLAEVQVPFTSVLYVAPSSAQVSEFSFRKIDQLVKYSPQLRTQIVQDSWSVSRKLFTTRSTITLRAAYLTPDRVRGIPAEVVIIDEAQDVLLRNIPIIRETLTHCDRVEGPIFRMLGTPKTYDGPLEYYFAQQSTQREWMIRCDACARWVEGLGEDNIGKRGLICNRCGSIINPFGSFTPDGKRYGATWIALGPPDAPLEGFRIPQLLLPYSFAYDRELFDQKWGQLLGKVDEYEPSEFYNEVLGVSYDSGNKPLKREDLHDVCQPGVRMINLDDLDATAPPQLVNGHVFCGVDWGSGGKSKTVFVAARYNEHQQYEIFYIKILEKQLADPENAVSEICRLLDVCRANYVGLDWGFGFGLNNRVRNYFGHGRTMVFCHTDQKEKLKYNQNAMTYTTNRSAVMTDLFGLIKKKQLTFRMSWKQLRDLNFAQDFLNVHKESTRFGRLKYDHPTGTTDDVVHASVFSLLSSFSVYPREDLN